MSTKPEKDNYPELTLAGEENAKPVLILDPSQVTEVENQKEEKEITPVRLDESQLTEEERKTVIEFAEKIDITSSNIVLQYGASAQNHISGFSETALEKVRTKDMGEVGEMIGTLVGELRGFDAEEESKGLFGFFKKGVDNLSRMKAKYAKVESNVERICTTLEGHQIVLMKDIAMLDQMYALNKTYLKELSMYILAGKRKLEQVQTQQMPQLFEKAKASGLPEDAQAANDMAEMCNRFDKKLHDLELTRMVSIQMFPQIRMVQNNDTLMAEKIQSTLVNTIPLWKSQMVLSLGLAHSRQAMQAQKEVTDMTNELLKKNADTLKMGTIEAAQESERGIVDIETLKHTNETLISTLDEVMKIQEEGRAKRRQAEQELGRIEGELKEKILAVRG